jgi:hypothetical protein
MSAAPFAQLLYLGLKGGDFDVGGFQFQACLGELLGSRVIARFGGDVALAQVCDSLVFLFQIGRPRCGAGFGDA